MVSIWKCRVLNFAVVRRAFIFALALSLAAFAPLPLSACALLASLPGDCSCPGPRSICDHMDMAQTGTHVASHPDRNCCRVTRAPLPEAQAKAPTAAAVGMPFVAAVAALPSAPPMRLLPAFETSQDISPPDPQPFLCIFLI